MKKKSRKHFVRPALCSLALALSLSVSGCGLSGSENRMGSADVGTKIYVIGQSKSVAFWDKVQQGALEAGEELGYEVVYTSASTITETDEQRKLIREAINAGAQSIVIAPIDPEDLNNDIQAAVDAGIKVLTIDSDAASSARSAYIGTINASSGAIAARHAAEYVTDYYKDKVLIVSESETLGSMQDRLSGFIPALMGNVKSRAAAAYSEQAQAAAQAELEGATDIPASVLNPARSSAAVAAAAGAPEESLAKAVANATAASAKTANVDVEIAARAAKLATDAQGGNGDLAAKYVREIMTGEVIDTPLDEQEAEPQYNKSEEAVAKINAAAATAAKAAAAQGGNSDAITAAAKDAAVKAALELGAGPGTAAQAAGQAAGMNGGDAMAASSAAAAEVDKAVNKKDENAAEGNKPQQGGAPDDNAQQGGDAGEIPQELIDAAQGAAKTAASQGAPAPSIEQAAANAAATTAIQIGASPAAAGQAAGQAAGMNGADGQAAGAAAAKMVAEALAAENGEGEKPGDAAQEKPDDAAQAPQTPSTISGGSPIDSINPVAGIMNCKGDSENAKAQITQMLSAAGGENIKVIFATSERSTIGACQAVSDLGLVGKVAIIGYNSNDDELTYMKNGTLTGLILQNPYNMGYLGVYYAGRLLVGENVAQIVDTGATYATVDNLNSDEIKLLLDPAEYTKK